MGGYEPYDRIPDRLSSFLDELHESGVMWATNTAWHPYGQERVFAASNLRTRPVRAIGSTGLRCGSYVDGTLVLDAAWDYFLTEAQARYAIDILPRAKEVLNAARSVDFVEEYFDYILAVTYRDRDSFVTDWREHEALQAQTILQFPRERPCALVLPAHMSKGYALERVQKTLGISPEETMVAADGTNDLTMLEPEVARWQVAPANAVDEVKQRVIANNGVVASRAHSDGVVDAARELMEKVP